MKDKSRFPEGRKTSLFLINSVVKLFLLQQTANFAGSSVTWNTVFERNPLLLFLSPELTLNNPYDILNRASKLIIKGFLSQFNNSLNDWVPEDIILFPGFDCTSLASGTLHQINWVICTLSDKIRKTSSYETGFVHLFLKITYF